MKFECQALFFMKTYTTICCIAWICTYNILVPDFLKLWTHTIVRSCIIEKSLKLRTVNAELMFDA